MIQLFLLKMDCGLPKAALISRENKLQYLSTVSSCVLETLYTTFKKNKDDQNVKTIII